MKVKPSEQGLFFISTRRALAAQLLEMHTPGFVGYSKTVVANAGVLAKALMPRGKNSPLAELPITWCCEIFVHKSGTVSVLVPFLFSMCITQYLESERSLPMLCVYTVLFQEFWSHFKQVAV